MARTHARVQAALWIDEDWRALSSSAQRVYLLLISQPQINHVGVLPYVPRRWARLAADTTIEDVAAALGELEQGRFIVVDEDTEEVLIRTFVKHDRIDAMPQVAALARRQFQEVQSARIKVCLFDTNPEFFTELEPLVQPLREPLDEPLVQPHAEGLWGSGRGSGSGGPSGSSPSERAKRELQDAHRSLGDEHAQGVEPDEDVDDDPEPVAVNLPSPVTAGDVGEEAQRQLRRLQPGGATA